MEIKLSSISSPLITHNNYINDLCIYVHIKCDKEIEVSRFARRDGSRFGKFVSIQAL